MQCNFKHIFMITAKNEMNQISTLNNPYGVDIPLKNKLNRTKLHKIYLAFFGLSTSFDYRLSSFTFFHDFY